ncbi:unnamed protein product [Nyctereutes procyonoides]|uniref:Vomeronasal type-1 receptor n=1 Tax=Nyctereutes procyonoides TaxID=34880 RepID=A0A811YVV2_NYCPR|nr:unnamed protein product [Nyctereutes procyonoides]
MLIFRGIPNIITSFGIRVEMGDTGCKTSTFQAVTFTPSSHKWAWLKYKIPAFIQPSLPFFWMINMAIYSVVLLRTVANRNITDDRLGYQIAYYIINISKYGIHSRFVLSLMTCSSIYLVNILYRHHKAAQNVRSTIQSSRSPENKATHVILILVSCFVFFYWTTTFLTVYLVYTSKKKQLEKFNSFFSSCYPTICSFFLIKNENRISRINFMKPPKRFFSS